MISILEVAAGSVSDLVSGEHEQFETIVDCEFSGGCCIGQR